MTDLTRFAAPLTYPTMNITLARPNTGLRPATSDPAPANKLPKRAPTVVAEVIVS